MSSSSKMSKIHQKTGSVCLICDEEIGDGKLTVLLHRTRRQTHNLCLPCAVGYLHPILESITRNLRQNIRRNVQYVDCPGAYHSILRNRCQCKVDVTKIVLPSVLSLSTDLFRISHVLRSPNVFLCPDEKCGNAMEVDPNFYELNLHCRECKVTWCRQCLVSPYHDRKTCLEHEVESSSSDNAQYISLMVKKGLIKYCSGCKAPTFRPGGCNKMSCDRCKTKWCWLCLKAGIDYEHFNSNGKEKCSGKLWEGTIK